MNLLILGGTTEASDLGRALAGDRRVRATISLAGRTQRPLPQPLPARVGGFGGVEGLSRYLTDHRIDALVDATHPFAARITANAISAARMAGAKLLVVIRPAWLPAPGDNWTMVPDMAAAATALGDTPRRVLLTVGQKDLSPFRAVPWHHFVLRSVDPPPPDAVPPDVTVLAARGPFLETDEHRLLVEHGIDVIVTKNSGGAATQAKLVAARKLGLPVVMVERRPLPQAETVGSIADVLAWLERLHAAPRGE
jgi:precorrin-6A/cobalt-precorrin-6A reductase